MQRNVWRWCSVAEDLYVSLSTQTTFLRSRSRPIRHTPLPFGASGSAACTHVARELAIGSPAVRRGIRGTGIVAGAERLAKMQWKMPAVSEGLNLETHIHGACKEMMQTSKRLLQEHRVTQLVKLIISQLGQRTKATWLSLNVCASPAVNSSKV